LLINSGAGLPGSTRYTSGVTLAPPPTSTQNLSPVGNHSEIIVEK
jgi:hypothetical protein